MAVTKHSVKALQRSHRVALALLLSAGVCLSVEAANIYRYKDASGRTVYNSSIPPEFVKNGYDILNESGQVIQTIPRALSSSEIAALEADKLAQQQEEEALRIQLEADSLLLRLFRTPEEIARKRDERLDQLDSQIEVLSVNVNKVNEEFARQTKVVENARAQNLEPAAQVLDSIASKTVELERLNDQLARLEEEKIAIADNAVNDMARLRVLLKLPEPEPEPEIVTEEPVVETSAD